MMNLTNMERISLKNHPEIKEDLIQKFIFENPKVLGLGEVSPIQREKIQPSGGRFDMLLATEDMETRYEVEVQLGATDPSHIIRTIEYWDIENKRYPQYDHCAVIIAEEITGRFMNVISLFNGHIPLIAIQMSAYKNGNDVSLTFTKIIDRLTIGDDDAEVNEVADRNYWLKRSTPDMVKLVDRICQEFGELVDGYELKYNKYYIGLANKAGVAKNFIEFKPKKSFMWIITKGTEGQDIYNKIENAGLVCNYDSRWRSFSFKIDSFDEFMKYKELIIELVKGSMDYLKVNE